jgi:hypothetical protein
MEIKLFQFRNQIKASTQGVSRLCWSLFEVTATRGKCAFFLDEVDLTQPGFIFT